MVVGPFSKWKHLSQFATMLARSHGWATSRKNGLVQPLLVLCIQGWYFWQGLPDLS